RRKHMKRETYERALRSAAQISCLALPLSACGPVYEPIEDASTGPGGDGDDGELSTAECEAALKAAYPMGDPHWFEQTPTERAETGVPVATLVQCCSAI